MVTREDVLKFLKALDEHNVQNRDFEGNVVAGRGVEIRKEYCKVFLEMFEGLEINIWETTTRLVVERKKPWPTPAEMVEYVGKVETAYRAKQESIASAEPRPASMVEAVIPTAKAANKKERMQEMFALALQGKFKEAASVCGGNDSIKKALEYGRLLYPDADDDWYEENISALRTMTKEQETCDHCKGVEACRTRGYRQAGVVDERTGMLNIMMMPCMLKKVESAENVSL